MSKYSPLGILLSLVVFTSFEGRSQDTTATHIIIDSLGNEIYYLQKKDKTPIAYYCPVFTPVCLDGTCYPIRINLFWNMGGDYLKYTLDADEILTKIEHLPFSEFDYGLLHRVIANSTSALGNYTIHELTDKKESKVDGITGATRPELQGAFVPDALYTSYTLWHLARRPKNDLVSYTQRILFESKQFGKLLSEPAFGAQKLAINYLLEHDSGRTVIRQLSPIIDSTDNGLTARCISLIPHTELNLTETRTLLSSTYSRSDNAEVKKAILKIWGSSGLPGNVETLIIAQELGNEFATFQSEIALLTATKNWPEPVYNTLLEKIDNTTNIMRREKIERLLFSREEAFPKKFRRLIKKRKSP